MKSTLFVLIIASCLTPGFLFGQEQVQEVHPFAIPASDDGLPGSGPIRRYPWFQNLWQNRRSQWAKAVEKDQGALVFLGDSITQSWGDNFGNQFPEVKVANRGISGDTTRGMLIRLHEDVLSLNPSGVVLLMGTNDLEERAEPNVIADNLKLIVAELKKHDAKMPIILCNVFPSSASKTRPTDKIKEINRLYQQAVKGDAQVTVLDTWTLFANSKGDAKPEEFPDLLHPNRLGYAKWGDALRPILATLDFLDRDPVISKLEPGYRPLFNGKDLTGWEFRPSTEADKRASANWRKNDPNAPPWPILTEAVNFQHQTQSTNGRYHAKSGRIVVTTPPEGRKIQQLYTTENFSNDLVLKLEFRATPNADSGVFLRGKQLQCRDYSLAGPYKNLKNYRPQDWNELVIVVRDRQAHCSCNGEVLEAAFKVPKSGPIGLEADRGQVEYRNIRIKPISEQLARATPESQGVSSEAIDRFVDAANKIDSVHSFMLLRHGKVVAEGWWAPFERNDRHQLYSLSKSFASTAVGLAVAEGKLNLDDPVVSFFPDQAPAKPTYNLKAMRIRDLLSMSTGHVGPDLRKFSFQSDANLTKEFLALPVEHKPGTHFFYNTPATYMCSAIVQKVTGQKIVDYLKPRLFDPLGIKDPFWTESKQGICHGGFGLNVRTEDIARFGQLYLQQGEWNGMRLLPTDWVAEATKRQTSNGSNPNSDWDQGYGYQFWRCRHNLYRGDGAFGQFCIVMPEHDAVLAVTSGTNDMGGIMQIAWEHLLPGFADHALRQNPKANQALKKKLGSLKLPTVEGKATSSFAKKVAGSTFKFEKNELGLTSVKIDSAPNNDRATMVTFKSDQGTHEIKCGHENWMRSRIPSLGNLAQRLPQTENVAIAASAAWSDDNHFRLRMWQNETPYRLDLEFEFGKDSLTLNGKYNVAFGPKQLPTLTAKRN